MARVAKVSTLMWPGLFRRFAGADGLQGQLRDMLVHEVLEGLLLPGAALPSVRNLAQSLGVSRTTVTLALQALVDHESELNFLGKPTAALKSLDNAGRVLYVGSLSKTLAHGLRLGYLVAPAALVRELRALRRLMMRHVSTNNQQAAAFFIAHGHQESFVRKLNAN